MTEFYLTAKQAFEFLRDNKFHKFHCKSMTTFRKWVDAGLIPYMSRPPVLGQKRIKKLFDLERVKGL